MCIASLVLTLLFVGVNCMFFQNRQYRPGCVTRLTSAHAYSLTWGQGANMTQFYQDLQAILVPRVPATDGHHTVRQYIVRRMSSLGWAVEEDFFTDSTPRGPVEFTNIIATWNPSAANRVIVACHYDSKLFDDFVFLGATDSAVPCALMLDSATKLQNFLAESNLRMRPDTTLQFVFFDGEEAFERWTATDSLYGSRHLARKWRDQPYATDASAANYLQNINLFVLLDLLGTSDTTIRRPHRDPGAAPYFNLLSSIETCLRNKRWLQRHWRVIFDRWRFARYIEDDHIPFQREGVQTLHLISDPFPRVWHRETDNLQSLDSLFILDFGAIFRIFLASLVTGA